MKSVIILSLLLLTSSLNAQAPLNFSGKWVFDQSKSDPGPGGSFLEGTETLIITQDANLLTIEKIMSRPNSEDIRSIEKYNLNAKESTEKSDMGTTIKNAKWSDDKQTLVITTIMTFDPGISKDEYRADDSYKLTDNGKTLVIDGISKNPAGTRKTVQAYNKK